VLVFFLFFEVISEVTEGGANFAAAVCVERICVKSTVAVAWHRSVGDFIFYGRTDSPLVGQGTPHYPGVPITLKHSTLGTTTLGEGSARRRNLYEKHTPIHKRQPFPRRDSNPQSQQANGRRPTP